MSVFSRGTASRSRVRTVIGGIAIAGASALVLAGCAAGGGGTDETSEPATPTEDLTLNIGTVLPQTGSLAFLGPPEEAGVQLGVNEVNEAAAGVTVEVTFGDSGDADNKAFETTVPKLQSEGVAAMIGAASSAVTKLFLDSNVSEGIITFSPANTSPDFTTWDDNGLYWRTAPSDLLQGEVIGNLLAEDGHQNVGIIYQNDAYGTGLFGVIKEVFEASGGTVVAEASYNTGDTSFDAQVATVTAANPDAIVLITFDEFATIAPLLVNAGQSAENFYLVDGNLKQWGTDVAVSLEGAKGTTPGPALADDFQERLNEAWTAEGNAELEDYSYAAESYDAVVLLALAALAAGSTDPAAIAEKLQEVSGGSGDGETCESFADCAEIINGGGVADYDGYSGGVAFDENGDPTEATIGIFQYGADNMFERLN